MTNVMVLGVLLTYGPMSGYEIQQKMRSAKTNEWAYVKPASIYHALRKLESEKLVSIKTIEQTGNRTKAIYEITLLGINTFDGMVINSLKKPSVVFPTVLYTALTFIDEAPREQVIQAIKVQQQGIMNIYEEMKEGQVEKEKMMEVPKNVLLIFENIYDQCELQLGFLENLINTLEGGNKSL
ncbi:PadR family transcriptional regulator [Bacillus sp. B19-2]|uniref:PadR family transcriptional regulator n=1 Tax=Bacillus sp. B19-2 TaxID=2929516 RepID=UPI001FB9E0C1|nr:PadR family transcriptional regulator [Bacillus sp. B19-2]MCJ2147805.1 PadR family transcriptional regulator [Bacillus sp. B19-2]